MLLLTAILVRVTSRRPDLFTQDRAGLNGKTFRILKFRSMQNDAEADLMKFFERQELDEQPLFKPESDERIIEIGKRFRSTCLDKLPQSLYVLMGCLSLVGPRPQARAEVAPCVTAAEHRPLVKPGITGLWQISDRSDLSRDEAVRLDLCCAENWSLIVLLVILLQTPEVVFGLVGAF